MGSGSIFDMLALLVEDSRVADCEIATLVRDLHLVQIFGLEFLEGDVADVKEVLLVLGNHHLADVLDDHQHSQEVDTKVLLACVVGQKEPLDKGHVVSESLFHDLGLELVKERAVLGVVVDSAEFLDDEEVELHDHL